MPQPFVHHRQMLAKLFALLLSTASVLAGGGGDFLSGQSEASLAAKSGHYVTNVAQFRMLSGVDYVAGCDFHLTGVVTLVDTNRDLVVLQDATGAVALNFRVEDQKLQVGQLVTLDGANCCPYFASFPDYPYRPSEWNIQTSFEFPFDLNQYRLARMRGYLRPPVTGEYSFWIASDNSSELWLSQDADPSKARTIASIPRFGYVAPHEWTRFPSQRSQPILLKAGEAYYIEALQEQTTGGENLSVAWQGPGLRQSVIDGRYLIPWSDGRGPTEAATNGILLEYWTNYSSGDLTGVGGGRRFESALTVKEVRASILGLGQLPKPDQIAPNRPLLAKDNYRWVEVEGLVKFTGADGDVAFLDLSDGQAQVPVRALHWSPEMSKQLKQLNKAVVRINGVCEGVYDLNEIMTPGLIWASAENSVSFIETFTTNAVPLARNQLTPSTTTTNPVVQGFYGIRGEVTFNDRVFGTDYIFVQADAAIVLVTLDDRTLKSHFKVGEWVDLSGALGPGKYLPVVTPLVITELGWHSMPLPIAAALGSSSPANQEGEWSEIEGVVHSVNTNGTLSIAGKDGSACLWLGQTPSNSLARYVDAKLRARGVLMLHLLDAPVLFIPSRNFVEVKEEAPEEPAGKPARPIAGLLSEGMESSWEHRARVIGEITYRDAQSFLIQDSSGGIRVQCAASPALQVGESVEVVAFPTMSGVVRTLTEAQVRPAKTIQRVSPKALDVSEAISSKQSGTLIFLTATLLDRKTNELGQVLELQEHQRIFSATLSTNSGSLPDMAAGSQLRVVGVCENGTTATLAPGEKSPTPQFLASLNILLRSPTDVTVISGPPWWNWKRTVTLVGALLTVLVVTLLWVHLLQRRLERQRAAQFAFSRQVLAQVEEERRRIAVNLHDSLGQILLVIKNHALLAIQRPPDEQGLRQRLDEISGASSQAIEEVRQITHGLRPYQLDRLGLSQAIRASVSRASTNISIVFASRVEDIDGLFDKEAEIHVYRIVQEAVTNVVKHSAATEAAVVIKKRPAVVSLSIRDNGRGFDPAKLSHRPRDLGYGLIGITERVRILGGTLTIDSRPGEGTSVTVEVPLPINKT